jgi:GTP cyclohydrolase IB
MAQEKRFLVDVGMEHLPFPMRVISRVCAEGQQTVADISISARIMQEFEAHWIDTFIRIVHQDRDRIRTQTLRANIADYMKELHAARVRIDFNYPFFVEKQTPVSKEKCLVRYLCTYSARASSARGDVHIRFGIDIPVITTYPVSAAHKPGGLFGQLSVLRVEIESRKDVFPEDLVGLADMHALAPVYSYLTEEDQVSLIERIHSREKTSVVMTDDVRKELARDRSVEWYSVQSYNYGMLHPYNTVIGIEKSMWVPFSGYGHEEI